MLLSGNAIDFRQGLAEIAWVPLQAEITVQQRLTAALTRLVRLTAGVMTRIGLVVFIVAPPRDATKRASPHPLTIAEAALVAFAKGPSFTLAA